MYNYLKQYTYFADNIFHKENRAHFVISACLGMYAFSNYIADEELTTNTIEEYLIYINEERYE